MPIILERGTKLVGKTLKCSGPKGCGSTVEFFAADLQVHVVSREVSGRCPCGRTLSFPAKDLPIGMDWNDIPSDR